MTARRDVPTFEGSVLGDMPEVARSDRRDDRLRTARAALIQLTQGSGPLTVAQLSNAVRVISRALLTIIGTRLNDPDEAGET